MDSFGSWYKHITLLRDTIIWLLGTHAKATLHSRHMEKAKKTLSYLFSRISTDPEFLECL
jgi:hypothetical protein